jgi:cytochrome c biogenesis protein CcdA
MLLLIIAIIAGVLTVLAPCILPLLPVIVGGSLADGKVNVKKAITVVVALGVSVIAFTLLLKVSTLFINVPPIVWSAISGVIIIFIGLTFVFPHLWENGFLAKLSAKSNQVLGRGDQQKSIAGDVLVGVALGPVFTTCSPTYFVVLATVLPTSFLLGLVYLMAYAIGLSVALLVITFVGQKLVEKLDILSNPESIYKKILGVLFILVGVSIIAGFDKQLETKIVNAGFFDVTKVEQKLLAYQKTLSSQEQREADNSNVPLLVSDIGTVATGTATSTTRGVASDTSRVSSNSVPALSTDQLLNIYAEKK